MGTIIVGAAVVLIVALIIRGMIRDKKNGTSHCSGNCNHCNTHHKC